MHKNFNGMLRGILTSVMILFFIVLSLSKSGHCNWKTWNEFHTIMLQIVSENLDSLQEVSMEPFGPFSGNRYPGMKAEFVAQFLKKLPASSGGEKMKVIELARRGFDAAGEYKGGGQRDRIIAEAQMKIALEVDRWDHKEAVELARKIRGPQTRERTLLQLGVLPYDTVPEEPARRVAYYRAQARQVHDIQEKARILMLAMQAVIDAGLQDSIRSHYAYDFVHQEKLDFLHELGKFDKKQALEFARLLREVRYLEINRGSSSLGYHFAWVDILYIRDLAEIDTDEAVKAALGLKTDSYVNQSGLRAAALMDLARILAPKDRGKAESIYRRAREIAKTVDSSDIETIEILLGINLNLTFAEVSTLPTEAEKDRWDEDQPVRKVFPKTFSSLSREIMSNLGEVNTFAVDADKWYSLREVYRRWENKDELFSFIRTGVVPALDNLKIPEKKKNLRISIPQVQAPWFADLAVIYRERGHSDAEVFMTRALDILGDTSLDKSEDYATTLVMLAFIDYDLKRAEEYILNRLPFVAKNEYEATAPFIELYRRDPQFVMNFLDSHRNFNIYHNRIVSFKLRDNGYLTLEASFFGHVAADIAGKKTSQETYAFMERYSDLQPETWNKAFTRLAEKDPSSLTAYIRASRKLPLKIEAAVSSFENEKISAVGFEILTAIDNPVYQVEGARRIARNGHVGAALEVVGRIEKPAYKLVGVFLVAEEVRVLALRK